MLLSWKQREGSQATRRVLADALQKAERKDLAELLQKEGEDKGTSNQPVQAQPPIPVTQPVKPNPRHGGLQSYVNEQGRHNLVIGRKLPTDTLLCRENIRKQGNLATLLQRQTHDFTYLKKRKEAITAVLVRDNWDDNTGGHAELIQGGPGQNLVKVRVTSQLGRGMDFTFSVYGRKASP
ncbi:putative salivary secreted peptide [Holothuria leucospilota]|uniref:Salivary secreted peptide n=1 Tax=Holothuria leucospilota TaxID=206669 RepID=A0A9Q1C3Y3_HOLLE|nr:putative salivary secreted peptide [Holothuria leucospilota]